MRKTISGFTIVELLIVIVVIGILAAITIVSYNGMQARATVAAAESDLRNIGQQTLLARVDATTFSGDSWFEILQAAELSIEDISNQKKVFAICWNNNNDFAIVAFQPVAKYSSMSNGDKVPYFSSTNGGLGTLTWDSSVSGPTVLSRTCNQTVPGSLDHTRGWSWQFPSIS